MNRVALLILASISVAARQDLLVDGFESPDGWRTGGGKRD